jgi:hypothetical protein
MPNKYPYRSDAGKLHYHSSASSDIKTIIIPPEKMEGHPVIVLSGIDRYPDTTIYYVLIASQPVGADGSVNSAGNSIMDLSIDPAMNITPRAAKELADGLDTVKGNWNITADSRSNFTYRFQSQLTSHVLPQLVQYAGTDTYMRTLEFLYRNNTQEKLASLNLGGQEIPLGINGIKYLQNHLRAALEDLQKKGMTSY